MTEKTFSSETQEEGKFYFSVCSATSKDLDYINPAFIVLKYFPFYRVRY